MIPLLTMLPLLGCTRPAPTETPAQPPTHATLQLDGAWDVQPWMGGGQNQPPEQLTLRATFSLPTASGGTLYLEGAWWQVQVTLNDTPLPPVTGGLVPVWIPLEAGLRAGQNTLQLTLSAPTAETSPLETGGSLSSRTREPARAQILRPPTLLLHPRDTHLDALAPHAVADGRLGAQATVQGAPTGATVRFQAVLDGEVLATLGEAPVSAGGLARLPPTAWSDRHRWQAGAAAPLIWLQAELLDAGGVVLDRMAERVGVRAVTVAQGQLRLDGAPRVLMGARIVHDPRTPLAAQLAALADGHINALEIHGEGLQSDWLDAADELGLPLVVVPRCIGRSGRGGGGGGGVPADLGALHKEQDARLLRLLAHHPSAVMLVTEGPVPGAALWSERLLDGTLEAGERLPVAGDLSQGAFDLPTQFMQLSPEAATCHPGQTCGQTWITEITPWWKQRRQDPGLPPVETLWSATAAAFQAVLASGGPGGIIPTPDGHRDQAGWAAAWRAVAEEAGLQRPDGAGRGPATVWVQGASPGGLIWVEAPHLPPVGAVADRQGEAVLSLYHRGGVTVREEGQTPQPVTLTAGQWQQRVWTPAVSRVQIHAEK